MCINPLDILGICQKNWMLYHNQQGLGVDQTMVQWYPKIRFFKPRFPIHIAIWGTVLNPNHNTLWLFNIAMENGPFIDGLPIKNGDFPWLC
jgi:hypothetical protein